MKISIDSRTIKKGEYFVPFKGEKFDGHDFIKQALENGARGVIEEDDLYELVRKKLDKHKPKIIGVAGSIGKTTFRSYLYSILKSKYKVFESDLNTKIGFCLRIFNEYKHQPIIVAEIGIDRIGEMKSTSSFIRPSISVITKLGKEHIESLKSLKNVVREEFEIFSYTKSKVKYVNSKDFRYYKKYTKVDKNYIFFDKVRINNNVLVNIKKLQVPNHEIDYLRGVCYLVKKHFRFTDADFCNAILQLKKPKGRTNIFNGKNGSLIVDDTYNAVCDQTIIEGIKFATKLSKAKKRKLTVVISNMVENGTTTESQHKKVAEFINSSGLSLVYLVGSDIDYYKKYLKIDFKEYLTADKISINPSQNDLIYIKATRRYRGPELVGKIKNL
jgi:UDP-N-acetylmuramoyl-tripeptide--D-alanyl-D-alanine ligase